ncbi:MAG TPA: hypothetical protein VFX32_02065 [Pseudolabrys sp.]|nr:hypothetical protein [Pseudolabrys sp.]
MTNLLVGAIVGFLSAFLLRSWQYRRDLWLKRIEGLCTALDAAAEASTKYWIGADAPASAAPAARILGLQARIDSMFADLELNNEPKLIPTLNDFRDSSTGGNFESIPFEADHDRARLVQIYASELISAIWEVAYHQLSFSKWCMRRRDDMHHARLFAFKNTKSFLE